MRAIVEIMTLSLVMIVAAELGAAALEPDWNAVSDTETVEVLTEDEDGSLRVTTVWLLVQDDEAYLRTGDTRWGSNVARSGEPAALSMESRTRSRTTSWPGGFRRPADRGCSRTSSRPTTRP